MQIINSLLAQAATDSEKITEIYNKFSLMPEWAFRLWPLMLFIAVATIFLFKRQKKIAQNQVDMAQMIQELLDKQK